MKKNFWLFFLLPVIITFADEQQIPTLPPKNATQSARTCRDLKGAYVTADFIYWKARQDQMVYCSKLILAFDSSPITIRLDSFEIEYRYKPGFRLGVGGNLPWNGWDLSLTWTRLHSSISSSTRSNTKNLVIVDGAVDDIAFLGDHGQINWDLTYNSLDFDWGRRLFLDSSFIIRPSFGLKTVWLDNDYTISMNNVELFNPSGPGLMGFKQERIYDFDIWGIGPVASFYGKWNWIYGLGLVGQISTSILWYHIDEDVVSKDNESDGGSSVSQIFVLLKYEANRLRPFIQAFVGLDWEWCFIPKWLSTQLALGYEAQYFWSMLDNPVGGEDIINLSFEGLTFKARIDF